MSQHEARIIWSRSTDSFAYADYNREHEWISGSGRRIPASSAPAFLGNGMNVDPEEAFVAAIASCHMLTFLAICARKRLTINHYEDAAVGFMEKNELGKLRVSRVLLSPQITFAAGPPSEKKLQAMHDLSHHECFIANSVTTDIQLSRLA